MVILKFLEKYGQLILILIIAIIIMWALMGFKMPKLGLPSLPGLGDGDDLDGDQDGSTYIFPDGEGNPVRVNRDNVDCGRPLFPGDRGEEVKLLQGVINWYIWYDGLGSSIPVNGRFDNATVSALKRIDKWDQYGSQYGHALFQFNVGYMLGEDAPCGM